MSMLVAGIGNIFLGDDAFGCEVIRVLSARPPIPNVRVADYGIRGLDLAYELLKPWDAVILIDASPRGGAPGTLYILEPEIPKAAAPQFDGHSMDPVKVLALAVSLGAQLPPIRIVACEPSPIANDTYSEMSDGLSGAVRRAVPQAVNEVEALVTHFLSLYPAAT